MRLLLHLLTEFKFARKRLGGKWYYLQQLDCGGFVGTTRYWSQLPPSLDEIVIKEENYCKIKRCHMRRRWWAFTIISVAILLVILTYVILDLIK